ncbi:hypothetical protein QYE76_015983 [Lolium multiflorum]|uniref:Retrotransposon gag domain-containing protein n=1 Tax=Lolium multiflorum TaxID=4521 RepID=A0AAD8X7A0_LOLMU|nr:hypothetical protein QYE76_015983 [Lolium multiflorum]
MAHHQIYAILNAGSTRNGGEEEGDRTPHANRRCNSENSASNDDSDYTIAEEEWEAAQDAITNNTPLPAGTSLGTLNAYQRILERNRVRLSNEQTNLNRRILAADQSSERRRASHVSASRSSHGVGRHRSRLSRLSEDDAREITSNLSMSFMTTDTAGMLRPKTVEGATANLATYLINQQPAPKGPMAQAHRGALESLAILGDKLVPLKEKSTLQASGSRHRSRDARDEITQSRIDRARRQRAAREVCDSDDSEESQEYDGEMRGADCLSYKIRETMPPKRLKPTPTDAAKYDGQQEPRSWIDDYLQTVILHKGNQIAVMQCLQLYLKDSARAWLRGLPKGSIKSWDDLVDAFVKNFQATYKRPVGIDEFLHCQQKLKESMRTYIGRNEKIEFEVVDWESQYHAILGRPAYAKFMVVPHYAYLKLKMPGNNGTNITVYGSFSGSDNCEREFHRIAANFGIKQEPIDFPFKSLALDDKEDERAKKLKKKPDDPAPKASTVGPSAADSKASAKDSKALALAASTSDGVVDATKAIGDEGTPRQNPSKEIFSELDEINAQGPILPRSFQKTEEKTKWGHEVARHQGGAAQALVAPACGVAPRDALYLPFRLHIVFVAKPPSRATIRKTFQTPPPPIPSRAIQRSPPAPCRRGESSPGGLFTTMVASGVMSE